MNVVKYLKRPQSLVLRLSEKRLIFLPDKLYQNMRFKEILGQKLNLKNPRSFNEKLQWLKLYDRNPLYTELVDKYEVKKYIAKKIGKEYIVPTLGVYKKFDDIDFDSLPNQFVIKCTHDSGSFVLVKSKKDLDIASVRKKINKCLKRNYYYSGREWPYKNVEPRIIIEPYLGENINDYKVQCINGEVDNIMICDGRFSKRGVRYYYFDADWNYLAYSHYDDIDKDTFSYPKPEMMDKVIELSKKIGKDFNQIRVDWYIVKNRIYFGELTFYTNSGFDDTITYEADIELGKKLSLKKDKK